MGLFKNIAINEGFFHDEDSYFEAQYFAEQEKEDMAREEAIAIHRIMEEDIQKHFDVTDGK